MQKKNTFPYLQKSSGTFLIKHKKYCTVLILYKILGIMKHMKPAKENVKKCKKNFSKD